MLALQRINKLMVHVIIKFWFLANESANYPKHLLNLYHKLRAWRRIDRQLADTVIECLMRHLYLLAEEFITFALAATNVSVEEKAEVAAALLRQPRDQLRPGFPAMPPLTPTTTLATRVGPQSWHFLQAMEIGKTIKSSFYKCYQGRILGVAMDCLMYR
jgi:hypothetical protein